MNDKIRIYTKSVGYITEISGYVGDNKVIVVSGKAGEPWQVQWSCSTIPAEVKCAALYIECMRRVIVHVEEYDDDSVSEFDDDWTGSNLMGG